MLFIILCFGETLSAQNLSMQIRSSSDTDKKIIDSIGYQTNHTSIKSLLSEAQLFSIKLETLGFLEHIISPIQKKNDSLFLYTIQLKNRTKFIHIYLGDVVVFKNLNNPIYSQDTIKISMSKTASFLNETLSVFEKQGYPLAKLKLTTIKKNKNTLFAQLSVNLGTARTINGIVINGIPNFPEGIKKSVNGMFKSKTYTQESLKKVEKEFNNYRFINQIKPPETLFTTDSTKIYVYLKKAKANKFDGFIGFTNNTKNELVLNGYLDLFLVNSLNKGEDFSLFWKSDGNNQKTFTTSIGLPYIFKSPLGIKANLTIFKQDTIFQNTNSSFDIGYLFNYSSRLYIGYQATESGTIQQSTSSLLKDYKNKFFTSSFDYSDTDASDLLFPELTKINLKIGVGSRKAASTKTNQFHYFMELLHLFRWNANSNFQVKSTHFYLKSTDYLSSELIRFGGINSIRGFNENSLQANFFSSVLTEYRYIISPQIYVHSILDFGYFKDDSINKKEQLLGLGFGFGLATKNGIINVVYANGSTKDQSIQLSNSIVQLRFKTQF